MKRSKLFRIVDDDGDDNFISAENYADAIGKFMAFVAEENNEPCEDSIQSVVFVGCLLEANFERKTSPQMQLAHEVAKELVRLQAEPSGTIRRGLIRAAATILSAIKAEDAA